VDLSKIIVLVLTVTALALLVWIEMKSRRNSRAANEHKEAEQAPERKNNGKRLS
jgi:hypothetical protein